MNQHEQATSLPPRRWSVWLRTLIATASPFLYTSVPILVFFLFIQLTGAQLAEQDGALRIFVDNLMRFLTLIGSIVMVWLMMSKLDRRPMSNLLLKFDGNAVKALAVDMLISIVAVVVVGFVVQAIFPQMVLPTPKIETPMGIYVISKFMAAFALQGIPEEIFFRGYLPQTIKTTPVRSMLITSFCFAIIHIITGPKVMPDAIFSLMIPTFFGFTAFVVTYLFKSTWAGVGIHAGLHVANGIAEYFQIASGNIVWFFCGLAYLVIGLIIFFRYRDRFRPENNHLPID